MTKYETLMTLAREHLETARVIQTERQRELRKGHARPDLSQALREHEDEAVRCLNRAAACRYGLQEAAR